MALGTLDIDPVAWRKVDRYLDVTRSALLFGGPVLLVEGIAEALLLPTIARHHVLRDRPDALQRLRGAVVVAIEGVDFEPYVRLLLTAQDGVRVADRLVVVTDGDSAGVGPGEDPPGMKRKSHLEALAKALGAADILDVFVSAHSLEVDLLQAGNAEAMRSAYLKLHPRSAAKWDQAVRASEANRAGKIQALFQTTRKGDFAQLLAEEIADSVEFQTPGYLSEGIMALVE